MKVNALEDLNWNTFYDDRVGTEMWHEWLHGVRIKFRFTLKTKNISLTGD